MSAVVVLDSCTDRSRQAVRDGDPAPFERLECISGQLRSVGAARDAGSRYLIGRHDPAGLWLATTDADSTVPADWIVRQLAHARLGARAVIGTVHVADWSRHPAHVGRHYRTRYDARDGHRHVHGANMSMAATAYLAAGGFPALATAEDAAIIERLVRGQRAGRLGRGSAGDDERPAGWPGTGRVRRVPRRTRLAGRPEMKDGSEERNQMGNASSAAAATGTFPAGQCPRVRSGGRRGSRPRRG